MIGSRDATTMLNLLQNIAFESLRTLYMAAPFLMLGLAMAGFLHLLLPASLIQRWLGHMGMSGVARAALIGVPLPVCSCGVVPLAVEMRRKGASSPASVSFLITTPESSADSILLTWGLMGPVMAIARPIAAFVTAVIGGIGAIAYLPDDDPAGADGERDLPTSGCAHGPDEPIHDGHDDHDHNHGTAEVDVTIRGRRALRVAWRRLLRRPIDDDAPARLWRDLIRPALRYGFVEMLDDLAFWLVLGVVAAGALAVALPDDLAARGLGSGIVPMLLMLAIGVPIYMCASASTPVAAALMAKGLSPGAAMVFLLAGPATNAATAILLLKIFGRRFVQIYLASVMIGALVAGLALDALIAWLGWTIASPLTMGGMSAFSLIAGVCLMVLVALLVWRLWRGAWATGARELRASVAALPLDRLERWWRRPRRLLAALSSMVALGWLVSGFHAVPGDSQGYAFVFGRLWRADLPPGLHWAPPAPIGDWQTWRTGYARKTDVGFKTDLELLADRKALARLADPEAWHSTVAAMNANPEQAKYLTADENLLELSFSVHYALRDPTKFFYGVDHSRDFVALYAETAARQFLASEPLESMLTAGRTTFESAVATAIQAALDRLDTGVAVTSVHVVDIHPPSGAVFAFRDVASAKEEKETRIHQARERLASEVPRARGEAAKITADATAVAESRRTEADGEAAAFIATAEVFGRDRELLGHLLWLESSEKVLAGRDKIIVPPGAARGRVSLWRDRPPVP